jgi:hypothetical protein
VDNTYSSRFLYILLLPWVLWISCPGALVALGGGILPLYIERQKIDEGMKKSIIAPLTAAYFLV